MKRFIVSAFLISLAVVAVDARSLCSRCASKYIWFNGTDYQCCADSENPEILDNCIYAGNHGYQVGDRLRPCTGIWNEGCAGQPCDPYSEAPAPEPVLLVMNGNGPRLTEPSRGPLFDMGTSRSIVRVGWPADTQTGWLAVDRNHNGRIDGVREMFSSLTRLSSGRFARNGYEALKELDMNGDGLVTSGDRAWSQVSVWFDRNRNGRSEPGEVRPLSTLGIESLVLTVEPAAATDPHGNRTTLRARVVTANRQLAWTYAVQPALSSLLGVQPVTLGRGCTAE